jgi:hypothetical protein
MTSRRPGTYRVLAFGGGLLTGCAVARLVMWGFQPAARKVGAST